MATNFHTFKVGIVVVLTHVTVEPRLLSR